MPVILVTKNETGPAVRLALVGDRHIGLVAHVIAVLMIRIEYRVQRRSRASQADVIRAIFDVTVNIGIVGGDRPDFVATYRAKIVSKKQRAAGHRGCASRFSPGSG